MTGRPELRRLFIEGGDFSWLDASSTLEEVSLTALRGTSEVPNRVQHLTGLRRMSLHGGKRLDIANLAGHPALETLEIESTGLLAGATALAGLPRLGALHLEDVGQVEDLSWVKPGVSIPQVTIVGTAPWIAEARARSIPTPRGWSFPPWTRR